MGGGVGVRLFICTRKLHKKHVSVCVRVCLLQAIMLCLLSFLMLGDV